MRTVTQIDRIADTATKKKLRVAAYCRVSTDTDAQLESLETQKSHYENYIRSRDDWEFAGLYYDDSITGTNTKKRTEFNLMIDACMDGEIDMIITKSISRFARNTLDCLKYIRQLKDKGIPDQSKRKSVYCFSKRVQCIVVYINSILYEIKIILNIVIAI